MSLEPGALSIDQGEQEPPDPIPLNF